MQKYMLEKMEKLVVDKAMETKQKYLDAYAPLIDEGVRKLMEETGIYDKYQEFIGKLHLINDVKNELEDLKLQTENNARDILRILQNTEEVFTNNEKCHLNTGYSQPSYVLQEFISDIMEKAVMRRLGIDLSHYDNVIKQFTESIIFVNSKAEIQNLLEDTLRCLEWEN